MNEQKIEQFFELLDAVSEQCGKPKKSMAAKALMMDVLAEHAFENIKGAIHAHLRDPECGMFDVTTAHIQSQIKRAQEQDGRPCADEAWAIAIQLDDEQKTVITNDDINKAWGFVCEIMPDQTAARMAFRKHYNRVCDDARTRSETPNWFPSVGLDSYSRDHVLKDGIKRGLLSHWQVKHLLIDAEDSSRKAIECSFDSAMQFDAKQKINELMQSLKLCNK
jgi:hypothetical protein